MNFTEETFFHIYSLQIKIGIFILSYRKARDTWIQVSEEIDSSQGEIFHLLNK